MNKTPITVLMEHLALKRLKAPIYEEMGKSGPDHKPTFQIRVLCNGMKAEGEGPSIKDAKQKAVENLLNIMNIKGDSKKVESVIVKKKIVDEVSDNNNYLRNSFEQMELDDEVHFNAIGALADLCKQNRLPLPEYKILKVTGPDHLKRFTMECCVTPIKESGTANKKQMATHIAAYKVLGQVEKELLKKKEMRKIKAVKQATIYENSDAVTRKYQKIKDPIVIDKSKESIFDCHKGYEKFGGNSTTLQKLLVSNEISTKNSFDVVKEIAKELDVKLITKIITSSTQLNGTPKSDMSLMRLATEPPVISLGYDIDDAAINLLDSLKVLCG